MTDTTHLPQAAQEALAEIQHLNASLAIARRRYYDALVDHDPIAQVAFALYQRKVYAEHDWPEDREVTWEDWWDLQIDSERDEWRSLAADIVGYVQTLETTSKYAAEVISESEERRRLSLLRGMEGEHLD